MNSFGVVVTSTVEVGLRSDQEIVKLRQVVRDEAIAQGFSLVDQTKFVTAASELARNTLLYGGGGDGVDHSSPVAPHGFGAASLA